MARNNEFKESYIKNCSYYYFEYIIINGFELENIRVDKKAYRDILVYYTGYEAPDDVYK